MFDAHEFNEQADRLDPDNVVGRYVENDFGHQQLITMRRFFWDCSGAGSKRVRACSGQIGWISTLAYGWNFAARSSVPMAACW